MINQDANRFADPKRRALLVKGGHIAMAAPAATLLLAASTKRSMAASYDTSSGHGNNGNGNGNGNGRGNGR